jgi:hypothetical protein
VLVFQFNKMDVSDEESGQELSILTQPDIVNRARNVTTVDFLPEKSKQLRNLGVFME